MDKHECDMADGMDDIEEMLNPNQMSEEEPSITLKGRRRAPTCACHKIFDDATPVGANVGARRCQ